ISCLIVGQHSWLDPWAARLVVQVRGQRERHPAAAIAAAYMLDKRAHAASTIGPATKSGVVLADRYIFSDAVYQDVLYNIPAEETLERHRAAGTLFPTAVLFVETTLEAAVHRIASRSRYARHYENSTDMLAIMRVYDRVLGSGRLDWLPPILKFDNGP